MPAETMNKPKISFLEQLTPDSILSASVLREPVTGKSQISQIIKTASTLYSTMAPIISRGVLGYIEYLDYDAELLDGQRIHCTLELRRNDENEITHIRIGHSPLSAVLIVSAGLRVGLAAEMPATLFL
jgi:hypothetical protein